MNGSNWRAATVAAISFALFNAGLMQSAQAGVIDTATMMHAARDAHIAAIQTQLAREDVATQLARFGVEPAAIEGRLAALSDRELAELSQHMQETPAGGDGLLAVIGLTFVVLIVLELVGVIDIFKRR